MRHIFFKSTSNRILLSFIFTLFLVVTNCKTAPPGLTTPMDGSSSPTSTPTPTPAESTTTQPSPLPNVGHVEVVTQDETSITLRWNKADGFSTYILLNKNNNSMENIDSEETPVTHKVSGLTSGTEYSFTLFTVNQNLNSSGYTFSAVTAPLNTEVFKPVEQNETSITLQWKKVDGISSYIIFSDENTINETLSADNERYTASNLKSAERYNFSLFTVFEYAKSSGNNITAVTAPLNTEVFKPVEQNETSITLQWKHVNSISSYIIFSAEIGINETLSADNERYTVSDLKSAERYNFSLFTVFEYAKSSGNDITAVTAPYNPANSEAVHQNETSILLQWSRVNNTHSYIFSFNNNETNITSLNETIQHRVSHLESGTLYEFKVFALFDDVRSKETNFLAATVPPNVSSVSVTERSLNNAVLKWEKPTKNWAYNLTANGTGVSITPMDRGDSVSYSVSNLLPGTLYTFSVITTFSGLKSTPYNGSFTTKINCESVTWKVTNKSIQGTVEGLFSNASASYNANIHYSSADKNVLFTGLYPGATYEINLMYENLQQCVNNPKVTIIPPLLSGHCEYLDSGYSALIRWIETAGVWTHVMVNISNQFKIIHGGELDVVINELQPAKTYKVSLVSVSGDRHSYPFFFNCKTDDRGVIAGLVMGILIFLILVCVAVFLFLKRPDIISRKKKFIAGSRKAGTKGKPISITKFPDHFHQLSLDENRGFSQEYEDLAPVGTDQTHKAATLPENKAKNRFTNILPYDWCRVKLSTSSPNEVLDYINASYLPGYTRNREYIACQGPLPSTVRDFWRMIWEQKIKRIVMVTNCTEGGRIKCERYWPEELKQSCLYGELLVTLISERKVSNWTLGEFRVKNKSNSEERTVKHFHFTAWPDHGVPQCTEVLIQFRGLVRQHIESDGTKAPTVVHCSAGVGRTGTFIALDVMLQQLEKEGAVSINDFVRRMRQHRSHMVQAESQYIFLHQCIMDSLTHNEKQEENIYENAEMIYENATALRELHNHKSDP
ncbi:receptor-type tyrosine-protein phosphatase H isoform X2 [Austrofundulus limnaeus]|uniref:protein-tyrosine-phosphatase n=2 Tax=Austrofundulus limnaeus TaxID=52670 RepID=A0A2I4B7L0_AUSLI|nr:PREDICTED: receptor-type tyrosine-protein phosphatase H isoform X2 [Austrofundulus limnaeus]